MSPRLGSSRWRPNRENRMRRCALGRLDEMTFPVLDLDRTGRVAHVGQMAELLVGEFHLSKG